MRIFLDTNVLISALMGHGLCRDLLGRLVLEDTVVLGEPVLAEVHRVLSEKFKVADSLWREVEHTLAAFERAPASNHEIDLPIEDADDILVVACAVTANVELIVTGDKELLELGRIEGIPIVTPRQCWMMRW